MALVPVPEIQRRLEELFPEGVTGRAALVRLSAARTVATFLFLRAAGDPDSPDVRRVRPSMVTWMGDTALERADDETFVENWHRAASRGQRALEDFFAGEGLDWQRWYRDNSRESIRDEVIRPLNQNFGAVLRAAGVATTGATPAWTLAEDFAQVFDADAGSSEVSRRIEAWKADHLGAAARARLAALRRLDSDDSVVITLPGRGERHLGAGVANVVTREVVETMAPLLLRRPFVLAICHAGDPIAAEDARALDQVGLALDPALALPDVLLLDAHDETIWFVEVVATAGEITPGRRAELEAWARARGIEIERCKFVTAYLSRNERAFKQTVAELAWETYVWFADEPHGVWHLTTVESFDDLP